MTVTSIRFVIYASSFLCFFLQIFFSLKVLADDNPYRDYTIFHSYEKKEGEKYLFKRTQYKLLKEQEGRCLFSIVDESGFPSFSKAGEQEYVVEKMYAVSSKERGECVLDAFSYKNKSLVFYRFEMEDFLELESKFNYFLNSDCLHNLILSKIGIASYSFFAVLKKDERTFVFSLLSSGAVYDVFTQLSSGPIDVVEIKRSADINL